MRNRPRTVRLVIVLALALALVAASCGDDGDESDAGATASDTGGGDSEPYEITVAFPTDLFSLDPQKVQEVPGRLVYGNIFEGLVRRTADGQDLVPVLAAELPTSVDDTTWEVTLRDDVTFASGKELSSADVVYTFERLFDPATESEQAPLLDTIESTEAVDDLTVRFTTTEPDPIFVSRLAYALILPEGQGEVAGFPDDGLDGTGAYQFVSRTPDIETVIELRDDYWADATGAPSKMTYRVIPDEATRLAALEAGELDIALSIAPDQVNQVPQAKQVTTTESALLRANTLRGPFADKRLREAANMAIDRQAIIDNLFNGEAEASQCHIASPNVFGHTDSLEAPEFDPDAARGLVEDAYGGETITFYGVGRFARQDEVAQAVAQYLTDVGFKIDLQFPQSIEVLTAQFSGDTSQYVDLLLFSSSAEFFDEQQQLQWLTSDGIYSAVKDPEVDALADEAGTSLDESARQDAFDELNQLMCDEVYNLYLYYPQEYYGLSEGIDWEPRSDGLVILTDVRSTD